MFAIIYDSVNLPPRKMKFTSGGKFTPRLRIIGLGVILCLFFLNETS